MPVSGPGITPRELGEFGLLKALPAQAVDRLAGLVRAQHYDRGEIVIEYRSTGTDVFLLIEGQLLVNRYSAAGQEVGYRRLWPNSYFGELATFDGAPRSVNVVALTPVRVGCIAGKDFAAMLETTPALARALLADVAGRIRELSDRLFELSAVSVGGRVEAEITRMALASGITGNGGIIANMPTHADLANLIGSQRETVTRALKQLADLGIVEKQGRSLVIRNFEALLDRTEEAGG